MKYILPFPRFVLRVVKVPCWAHMCPPPASASHGTGKHAVVLLAPYALSETEGFWSLSTLSKWSPWDTPWCCFHRSCCCRFRTVSVDPAPLPTLSTLSCFPAAGFLGPDAYLPHHLQFLLHFRLAPQLCAPLGSLGILSASLSCHLPPGGLTWYVCPAHPAGRHFRQALRKHGPTPLPCPTPCSSPEAHRCCRCGSGAREWGQFQALPQRSRALWVILGPALDRGRPMAL